MMDGYVYKQTAINAICQDWCNRDYCGDCHFYGARQAIDALKALPDADVQPVRHGHWETIEGWDGDELYRCSECGAEFVLIDGTPKDNDYWFCPHCGADMRGEQNV